MKKLLLKHVCVNIGSFVHILIYGLLKKNMPTMTIGFFETVNYIYLNVSKNQIPTACVVGGGAVAQW